MKIILCLDWTPEPGPTAVLSPWDGPQGASALEALENSLVGVLVDEGLRLKDQMGRGEITALVLGPRRGRKVLRHALAMGADRAVLLECAAPGICMDAGQRAHAFAAFLQGQTPDLLILDEHPLLARGRGIPSLQWALRKIGIPCAGIVERLDWKSGKLRCLRSTGGGTDRIEGDLPLALTVRGGPAEARRPGILEILEAMRRPIETIAADGGPPSAEVLSVDPLPPRHRGRIVGQGPQAVEALLDLLRNEARVLPGLKKP